MPLLELAARLKALGDGCSDVGVSACTAKSNGAREGCSGDKRRTEMTWDDLGPSCSADLKRRISKLAAKSIDDSDAIEPSLLGTGAKDELCDMREPCDRRLPRAAEEQLPDPSKECPEGKSAKHWRRLEGLVELKLREWLTGSPPLSLPVGSIEIFDILGRNFM